MLSIPGGRTDASLRLALTLDKIFIAPDPSRSWRNVKRWGGGLEKAVGPCVRA